MNFELFNLRPDCICDSPETEHDDGEVDDNYDAGDEKAESDTSVQESQQRVSSGQLRS